MSDDEYDPYMDPDLEFLTLTSWRREALLKYVEKIEHYLDRLLAPKQESIKRIFKNLSPENVIFFASAERGRKELLYDIVWAEVSGDILSDILLIGEIELARSRIEILKDFNKLLIGKSPIKILVFSLSENQDHHRTILKADELMDEMEEAIEKFRNTEPCETYILYDIGSRMKRIIQIPEDRSQFHYLCA